jgi:hypothetical protein
MDYSKISPNLYCGSCPQTPADVDSLLHDIGITAILTLQTQEDFEYWGIDWERLAAHYKKLGIKVQRVPVLDFSPDDLQLLSCHQCDCALVLFRIVTRQ